MLLTIIKKSSFILLFLIMSISGFSQTSIKGVLADTVMGYKVPKAAITLIDNNDSTLIKFTRSDANGEFTLSNIPKGKYVILIAHPMYAGYSDAFEITDQPELNLGQIQMLSEQMLLKELTVLSSDAIKIKGDTIEYTADSFKVKQDATVEDLFKKLPGIQVNKNGEIIAQGKRVEKVLVDGDEFFSDDPTVATQNLKAESVDKVQVYEKKDEQSGSTDQGVQTINITLKDDAKKGYFGKLKSGAGTDDDISNVFYNNEAMINKFSARRKLSAYLVHSNSGKVGLTREEGNNYAGKSNNGWMDADGGFSFMTSQSDDEYESFSSKYQGQGIPRSINGGSVFDTKWNKGKHHFNASYQFKQIDNEATSDVTSENYLADTVFYKKDTTQTFTVNNRHNFNMLYDIKLDSLSTLKWTVNGSFTENNKDNFYKSYTLNEDNDSVSTNNRTVSSNSDVTNVNSTLNYFKKFKKVDRSLNLTAEFTNKNTQITSELLSTNNIFLANNVLLLQSTTDQHKSIDRVENTLKAGATYKEPISKTSILEFRYIFNLNNQVADRFTFNDVGDNTYNSLDSTLSSQYVFDFLSHRAGLNYHFKKNKTSLKIGSDISTQAYNQVDKLNDTTLNRNFLNFFPTATFVYAFSKMQQFRLNYNGVTNQPGISQIQPLKDNTDPFNITIGNPDLNPSFTHAVSGSYNNNQVLKGRYFFSWFGFNYITNDIISKSSVDEYNRNQTQYVNNPNGNMNGYAGINYYIEIKKYDANVDFGLNSNFSKNSNIINDVTNVTDNTSFSGNFDFGKDIEEWFSSSVNYSYSYNISGSSIQDNANIKYSTQAIGGDVEFVIKKRFIINTEATYNIRQKTVTFNQNNNVLIWNADLDFKVFKNRTGVFTLHVNDILNQNLGFQRNASAYSIVQTRYNVIKRYWMLSFTWNFNSNKEKKPQDEDEW